MSVEWNVADVDFWGVDTCQLPRTAPDATLMCHVGRRIEKTQYHVERQYSTATITRYKFSHVCLSVV